MNSLPLLFHALVPGVVLLFAFFFVMGAAYLVFRTTRSAAPFEKTVPFTPESGDPS